MTISETMSNEELPGLDLSKVGALQQKRTLAFVNHFVVTTVQFLNDFMKKCELKLMNFERKLEKVEAAVVLLEARLSSIPEVNTEPEAKAEVTPPDETASSPPADQSETTPVQPEGQAEPAPEPKPSQPEYIKFVKMVQVGVPIEAVKLKVSLEGLDPGIFVKILSNNK